MLWFILLQLSISEHDEHRKRAFKIFRKFSGNPDSFPDRILPRKVAKLALDTDGSIDQASVLIKVANSLGNNNTGDQDLEVPRVTLPLYSNTIYTLT